MKDWDEGRKEIRTWLHPRCATRGEFEFWDAFFDDLTDWFDGLFNDPVTWYDYVMGEDSTAIPAAHAAERRFRQEAWDRGYDLREWWERVADLR